MTEAIRTVADITLRIVRDGMMSFLKAFPFHCAKRQELGDP